MKEEKIISDEELGKIREFARKDVTAGEIYTFPVILCDNDIDRDGEKFTKEALDELARLFVGKTGIFDHHMSSKDQTARIYSTQVIRDESKTTADGEAYMCVRAMAYMLRNEKNKDLIDEIEAGIKKETSVNCGVRSIKCSVCGKDIRAEGCEHVKGRTYGGKICSHLLCEPFDAYEWSFVAVPAQKNAGVTKSFTAGGENDRVADEIRRELNSETANIACELIPELSREITGDICAALTLRKLKDLRDALTARHGKTRAPVSQLIPREGRGKDGVNYDEYKI